MLYSIQSDDGQVYGKFPLPEVGLTADEWTWKLRGELGGILGWNGVKTSPLVLDSQTGETVDRVVVDIEPALDNEQRINRVHAAVVFIGLVTPP